MTRVPHWTFTIRAAIDTGGETEFAKRLRALASGAMLPTYTTQSYVHEPPRFGDLLAIGVVPTAALYTRALEEIQLGIAHFRRAPDAIFQYVSFDVVAASWFDPGHGWVDLDTP